jgi:hypothetical protein
LQIPRVLCTDTLLGLPDMRSHLGGRSGTCSSLWGLIC